MVGVYAAVSVAHIMEDCFVGAQEGALILLPGDVDILLRGGVDLLGKISEATRDPKADLAKEFDETVKALVVELGAMLLPRSKTSGGPAEAAVTPVPGPMAVGRRIERRSPPPWE